MSRLIGILFGAYASSALAVAPATSSYVVRLTRMSPPAFTVTARWPSASRLEMDTTRPGDVPELLEHGWPAVIARLKVSDGSGKTLELVPQEAAGWTLPAGVQGPISAEYEVDTRLLADRAWPAPREAVFVDAGVLSIIGRALFMTSDAMKSATVRFELPEGWRPYAPWRDLEGGSNRAFQIDSVEHLRENLVVMTRRAPATAEAAGFRLIIVPTGDWLGLESELKRVARAHVRSFVDLMGFHGEDTYLALLLPIRDTGAESFRQSFALTYPEPPSRANEANWANRIGHEIFHYWNGWRLAGADYMASQWFQEGFTEYAANVSMVATKLMTPEQFRDKLAKHVGNYRRLTTSLDNPGTHKGPPLYSGGALIAFIWDVSIREATNGTRGLGDFMRALWQRCNGAQRPYTRDDIVAALRATADRDWAAFLDAHVSGTAPLPIEPAFQGVGLRLLEGADGKPRVVENPAASATAKRTWKLILRGD